MQISRKTDMKEQKFVQFFSGHIRRLLLHRKDLLLPPMSQWNPSCSFGVVYAFSWTLLGFFDENGEFCHGPASCRLSCSKNLDQFRGLLKLSRVFVSHHWSGQLLGRFPAPQLLYWHVSPWLPVAKWVHWWPRFNFGCHHEGIKKVNFLHSELQT